MLCCALDLPMIIVFTKIDNTPGEVYKENLEKIKKIMQKNLKKNAVVIKSEEDMLPIMKMAGSGALCPIFSVSAVTGECIELIKKFVYLLPMRNVRE